MAPIKPADIVEAVSSTWLHVPAESQIKSQPRCDAPVGLGVSSAVLLRERERHCPVGGPYPDLSCAQQHGSGPVPGEVRGYRPDGRADGVDILHSVTGDWLHYGNTTAD